MIDNYTPEFIDYNIKNDAGDTIAHKRLKNTTNETMKDMSLRIFNSHPKKEKKVKAK
jgi:hypothetical protein